MENANLLLYINLSGEVFYIIAHRMKSQKVKEDLQQRVYNDLALSICHPTVIQNLVKGSLQLLDLNMSDVRILMDRIVHSSIMTVNTYSMEKLFELTLIATRYQYTVCQYPTDILLIAMNHLDTIRKSITDAVGIQLCEKLHLTLVDRLTSEDSLRMQEYRYAILTYLADVKLKMTNLIKLGKQKPTGEFVKESTDNNLSRPELHKPGKIEITRTNRKNSQNDDESESDTESTIDIEDDELDDSTLNDSTYLKLLDDCDELFEDMGCHFEDVNVLVDSDSKTFEVYEEDEILEIEFGEDVSESRESDLPPVESYVIRFGKCEKTNEVGDNEETSSVPLITTYDLHGSRGITLGQSIYDIPGNSDEEFSNDDKKFTDKKLKGSQSKKVKGMESPEISDKKAVQDLDLCSILLGCNQSLDTSFVCKSQFSSLTGTTDGRRSDGTSLNLGDIAEEEDEAQSQLKNSNTNPSSMSGINVIRFDARTNRSNSKAALAKISKEFDIENESEDNDIIGQRDNLFNFTDDE